MKTTFALLFAFFCATGAHAESEKISSADLTKQLAEAETEMTTALDALSKKQDARGQELLSAAQKQWLVFRDAEAAAEVAAAHGADDAAIELLAAKVELTEARTEQLRTRTTPED